MLLQENLNLFLSDFGVEATLRQRSVTKTIQVIFDEDYSLMELGAEGRSLTVCCKSSDVLGTRHGNTLSIEGNDYTIVGVQPESDGAFTDLILKQGVGTVPDPGVSSMLKVPFRFGDATPKPIYLVGSGTTVFTSQIIISTPFDGIGATLSLGDDLVRDRLIRANQIAPAEQGEYETSPGYLYSVSTQLLLSIYPGVGATKGSGFVILEM